MSMPPMSRRSLTGTGNKCSICCNSTLCNNNCDPTTNVHATIHQYMPPVPTLDPCLDLHPDCARITDCASVWAKLNCPGMCNTDGCRR
ncbi:hypothetical protein MAR_002754, partial [Mya arenaria]